MTDYFQAVLDEEKEAWDNGTYDIEMLDMMRKEDRCVGLKLSKRMINELVDILDTHLENSLNIKYYQPDDYMYLSGLLRVLRSCVNYYEDGTIIYDTEDEDTNDES